MDKHPIESIMTTTMENIRDMVDVNTVVGDPIAAADGATIIPISRVSFGFAAGGGEYGAQPELNATPFAGGTGAGVTVQPVGFLTIAEGQVRLTPVQYAAPIDRVIDLIPGLVEDVKSFLEGGDQSAPGQQPFH